MSDVAARLEAAIARVRELEALLVANRSARHDLTREHGMALVLLRNLRDEAMRKAA